MKGRGGCDEGVGVMKGRGGYAGGMLLERSLMLKGCNSWVPGLKCLVFGCFYCLHSTWL